jgi:TolA-binding protein
MGLHRRNWLYETKWQEHERRIHALEEHIQDTEARYAELENKFNILAMQMNAVLFPEDERLMQSHEDQRLRDYRERRRHD